ncbi:MAG: cellulase family glycosylhydrolase [Rhodobacteraceae bacterium]|nr:cellulase family glycosylhydrolase [Paracoccaceae bacterium]
MPRLTLLLLALLAGTAQAEPISLQRGVNTTLWLEWPSIGDMLANPSHLETFPDVRRDVTPAMYASLLAQGFDFVRMPVDPGPLVAFGPGERQDQLLQGIRIAAATAVAAGLKVVVDLHPIPRGGDIGGVESIIGDKWPDYVTLVGRVAEVLNGFPADKVALELLNEPPFDCDAVYGGAPARWPAMQAAAHAAARAAAPDMTIVLTGACWSQANALAALDPALIPDDNVLWTFHSYEPFLFTHQGAGWTGPPAKHIWNLPYPPSAVTDEIAAEVTAAAIQHMIAETGEADVAAIEQAIADYRQLPETAVTYDVTRAAEWADQHGIPRSRIFLGEFGALHTAGDRRLPREWFHAFLADKRQAAEDVGMSWAVLGYVGGMGIAPDDDPERRLAPETCAALGLPCAP